MAENQFATRINPDSTEKSLSVFTKGYWNDEFDRLHRIVQVNGRTLIGCMVEMDDYYNTRIGGSELTNVSVGRASLEKTVKAAELLKAYLVKYKLYVAKT